MWFWLLDSTEDMEDFMIGDDENLNFVFTAAEKWDPEDLAGGLTGSKIFADAVCIGKSGIC